MLQELLGARKQLGLTQAELAKILGISRNYLALIETGQRKIPASVTDWLVTFLKQKSVEPLSSSADPPGPCPLCAEKDKEIVWLKEQVAGLVSALAAKPTMRASVPLAYGAEGGAGDKRKRKEA